MKSDSEIVRWMITCMVIGLIVLALDYILSNPFSSLEYVILISAWCISVRNRVVATRVRQLFTAIAALLLFHWFVKDIKYNAFYGDANAMIRIFLWYLYYIPLIFIPLVSYFIADCIGVKSDESRVRKKKWLFVVGAAMFVMVLTNNFHQFVFVFKGGINEKEYSYGVGYYLILAWAVVLFLIALHNIISKYKYTKRPYQIMLMLTPLLIILLYCILAISGLRLALRNFITLPNIFCLCIIWFWESCLQTGLIRSNYNYDRIFEKASISAEITDERGRVYYRAGNVEGLSFQRSGEEATGSLTSDGRIIRASHVSGGYVYWIDDVRDIVKIEEELRDVREHLSEEHEILLAEKELKEEELSVLTKTRIYDMISEKVSPQLRQIESLLDFLETNYDKRLLAALCILTVYIKRVSNLLMLAESGDYLDIRELELSIKESCDYIELYGAKCERFFNASGKVESKKLIEMYDSFEEIIERNIENLHDVKIELAGAFSEGGDA